MDAQVKERLLQGLTLADVEELARDKWKHEAPKQIDLNNPPKEPYRFQEYPKAVYNHDNGHVMLVHSRKQEADAGKEGFVSKPAIDKFDYTKIRNGRAMSLEESAAERERQERGSIQQVELVSRESA